MPVNASYSLGRILEHVYIKSNTLPPVKWVGVWNLLPYPPKESEASTSMCGGAPQRQPHRKSLPDDVLDSENHPDTQGSQLMPACATHSKPNDPFCWVALVLFGALGDWRSHSSEQDRFVNKITTKQIILPFGCINICICKTTVIYRAYTEQ